MITAKFGSKTFEISATKIYTPNGITYDESITTEEVEVEGKKPTLNIKGLGLKNLSFTVMLDARFVTVESEISYWDKILLNKKSENFSIGKNTIGKFYLIQVSKSNIVLAKDGTYIKCTLTLTFKEDGAGANNELFPPKKATSVINSASTSSNKNIKVGTMIKPKSGTYWYYTASGAINRTGKRGKAYNKSMKVSYIFQNGKAINPQGLGWMIPADVEIV